MQSKSTLKFAISAKNKCWNGIVVLITLIGLVQGASPTNIAVALANAYTVKFYAADPAPGEKGWAG